jgi:hypothetical protein
MRIESPEGAIELVNEPTYSFASTDNLRTYPLELNLSPKSRPTSIHGILFKGEPVAILANDGGASGVHEHSAALVEGFLYVAVGDSVVCMSLAPAQIRWSLQVDPATCFGVYFDVQHKALISHGELEVARLSESGSVLWSASGADIFSEGVTLNSRFIEAVDFNGKTYRFEYESGLPPSV